MSCQGDPERPKTLISKDGKSPAKKEVVQEETVYSEPEQSTDTTPRDELTLKVKVKDPKAIAQFRASALSILNHRLKDNPTSYALVEVDTWQYEFVYDGQMSAPGVYAGVWVDFKPDHTFSYGKYGTVKGTGKYNYHFDREELLMIDDNPSK